MIRRQGAGGAQLKRSGEEDDGEDSAGLSLPMRCADCARKYKSSQECRFKLKHTAPPAFAPSESLLLHRSGAQRGEPADPSRQHPARPFYAFGVSHVLFPTLKSGFKGIRRRAADGKWEASAARYKMQPDYIPRQ